MRLHADHQDAAQDRELGDRWLNGRRSPDSTSDAALAALSASAPAGTVNERCVLPAVLTFGTIMHDEDVRLGDLAEKTEAA